PLASRVDRGGERASLPSQRVLDANRQVGDDRAVDDAFVLELLEALAEHPVGDVGNRAAQRREPAAAVEQDVDDGARPAAADELAGAVEARAEGRWGSVNLGHDRRPLV